MSNFIRVLTGVASGREFVLEQKEVLCGRGNNSDFVIADSNISRCHCRFVPVDHSSEYMLEDLNSSNGTLVNNSLIQSKVLSTGDRIQIGSTLMEFTTEGSASETSISRDRLKPKVDVLKPMHDSPVESYHASEGKQSFVPDDVDLDIVYRVSLTLLASPTVESLCRNVSQMVCDWAGTDQAVLALLAPNGRDFATTYPSSVPQEESSSDDTAKPPRVKYNVELVDHVIDRRLPVLSSFQVALGTLPSIANQATECKAICVPIDNGEKLLGIIYLDDLSRTSKRSETMFTSASLRTLTAVGKQCAAAIENIQIKPTSDPRSTTEQLVSAVSHRINNLLHLSNGGEFLVDAGLGSSDLERVSEGWSIVRRCQNQISQLSVNLSTFCHDFEPRRRSVNLHDSIEVAASEIGNCFDRARLKINHQTASDFTIELDELHFPRVIENVLCVGLMASNAGDGGQDGVVVETKLVDESVLIRVSFRHFDDRFNLAELMTTDGKLNKVKGEMGLLELLVSRKIVEGLGGTIEGICKAENLDSIEVRFPIE